MKGTYLCAIAAKYKIDIIIVCSQSAESGKVYVYSSSWVLGQVYMYVHSYIVLYYVERT